MAWAKKIYVATTDNGIYFTNDFINPNIQPIWEAVNDGLPHLQCREFHLDPFHQEDRQYVLLGDYNHISHEGIFRRYIESPWEEILSADDFAHVCGWDNSYLSAYITGFYSDETVDGRLWAVGQIHGPDRYYGAFGLGPYFENRAVFSDDWGDIWQSVPTWWAGTNIGNPSSIRGVGNTIYIRDGGGTGDRPYIEYSYDMGNSWYYISTDLVQYSLGGFLNPITPNRFYYDTYGIAFRYFQDGSLYTTINNINLGTSQWDTIWYNASESLHMRLIYERKLYTTYDGWDTVNSPNDISTGYRTESLSPYAGDNSDYVILGLQHVTSSEPDNPAIATLYGDDDINLLQIAGNNWDTPPYTNSIPANSNPCRCGVQGVHKTGYVYVNAVAMPEYADTNPDSQGVPMEGDRSAWNARFYKNRHTSDINSGSATSIHHTLSTHYINKTTGSYKAAPGDHSHYLKDMSSGSSTAGEIFTSLGTGSATWHTLTDHSHAGSAIGDGGRFNADHLSSESQPINFALTYYSGSIIWKPINDWALSIVENTNIDSSDKEFIVPPNTELQILWAWIEFTSTATSGSRQVEIQLTDSLNNIIGKWQAGATQSNNLVRKYLFGMVIPDLTSFRDDSYLMTPIPSSTFLLAGQKIRIWDNKTVDSFADDMIVRLQYSYHTV